MKPTAESQQPPLIRLSEALSRHFIVLALALALAGLHLTIFYRPDLQRMDGDHSIQIYLAQQALEGSPPYVAGLYAKTPMTPLLTAGAIAVGRALSVSDVMSGRLLFVGLGALGVLAVCLAGAASFTGRPWRQGAGGAAAGGLVAAATLLAFRLFSESAARGMEPKLILVAFGYLALWLTARRRWGWAGACAALAFLAWQPAGLFPLAVLLAAVCQSGEGRLKALGRAVLGMCLPLAAAGAYLAATEALGPAWRQAGLGALTFGQEAVGKGSLSERLTHNPARIYGLTPKYFLSAQPVFIAGLLGWLGLAAVEPLRAAWRQRAGGRWPRRLWEAARRPAQLPIMVVGAGFLAFSALDFQSGPDFLPLLPLAALGIGWLWLMLSDHLTPRRLLGATGLGGVIVSVALIGLGAAQVWQEPMDTPVLQRQMVVSDRLYEIVGDDAEAQFFGCLAPLVFRRQENATQVLHLGIKSMNLMAREFGDVAALAALIEEQETPALALAGEVAGNAALEALIAANYEPYPVDLRICRDRKLSVVWMRKPLAPAP